MDRSICHSIPFQTRQSHAGLSHVTPFRPSWALPDWGQIASLSQGSSTTAAGEDRAKSGGPALSQGQDRSQPVTVSTSFIVAAKAGIRTSGLSNGQSNGRNLPRAHVSSAPFGPKAASRAAARSEGRPPGPDPSAERPGRAVCDRHAVMRKALTARPDHPHQQTILAPELVIKRRCNVNGNQADENRLGIGMPLAIRIAVVVAQ